jgi:oxygen-independent coproporphyrinogen-3 oxidase
MARRPGRVQAVVLASPIPRQVTHVLGLYIHVPFCAAICNYCNFNRGLFDASVKERYVQALLTEIRRHADGSPADTIFFGGGTPSLLSPAEIAAIVRECRAAFTMAVGTEVTLEANPESVSEESLAGFREAGVNRLSFGVQSLRDDELVRLSRLHSAGRAEAALAMARGAGFDNVSLDLMMALPQQSIAQWLDSVQAAIALSPDHLSFYILEVYPNLPLKTEMRRSNWTVAPDDDVADMYLAGLARFDEAGFRQYEISNTCRPGRESRHNLKYWRDGEWLGFGPGAHSTRLGVRTKNVSATEGYIQALSSGDPLEVERRTLSPQVRLEEALFTGLRLNAGVDLATMEGRYGVDPWEKFGGDLAPFVVEGMLIYDSAQRILRLTRSGMLMAHEVMAVFLGAEE